MLICTISFDSICSAKPKLLAGLHTFFSFSFALSSARPHTVRPVYLFFDSTIREISSEKRVDIYYERERGDTFHVRTQEEVSVD